MMKYLALAAVLVACSDDSSSKTVYFAASHATADTFLDYPWPSDTRLDANGAPDLTGFPNRRNVPILTNLMSLVPLRQGFPVMAAGYFRFTAPIPDVTIDNVMTNGPVYLIDIDVQSPERGTLYPVVAQTLPKDPYVPDNLLAVAPRPGVVLRGDTQYAYVIGKALAPGFARPSALRENDPAFAAMWQTLDQAGIARSDVLAATVFTTGDEIARVAARAEAVRGAYHPTIDNVQLVGDASYDGFCRLSATITMPQFQIGAPPFDTGGTFDLSSDPLPAKQADMTIPVTITLPKEAMPATGWPLYQFFHGSGGLSTGIVDLGPSLDSSDMPTPGKGPGYVVALHHIAAASSALPLNPERFQGATDYEYLNINNLAAFPQTFQQGVFEQRMLLDALLALHVPQATLAACTGISTPTGDHFFDPAKLVAGGQSMGGMYTNMVGAVEPRFGALVPTGAGGYWNFMILESTIVPGARNLLGTALGIDDANLVFFHPAMNLINLAWETAEPMAYMARIGRRPLPGVPVHHVYEPVGMGDSYFPIDVYDAAALAYGHEEAGTQVWPSMQDALALDGLGGLLSYPVRGNESGKTRVVVQYMGDGIVDPHYIYRQLDAVKHQYGCFLETYLATGTPTVPAPGGLTDPCN